MNYKIIIPARYGSTRLPGKPLVDINGKPLIQHVCERAMESQALSVTVATDDARVAKVVEGFGGQVCMTSSQHLSGTDRLAETVELLGEADDTIVVNLQGDEPQISPQLLDQVAMLLQSRADTVMATLCEAITDRDELMDPSVVKVVTDALGYALYFSRAPIPWHRQHFAESPPDTLPEGLTYYRHVGIYAYRVGFLKTLPTLDYCAVEQAECLEQLRVLYWGHRIQVAEAAAPSGIGVDTPEDVRRARHLMPLLR